jgi:hypothetical protein
MRHRQRVHNRRQKGLIDGHGTRKSSPMRLRLSARFLFAFLLAPLAPLALYLAFNREMGVRAALDAAVVAYFHAAVGIPILLLLRRAGRLGIAQVIGVAALVGATPITILTLSIPTPSFESDGGIVMVLNGRMTNAGAWQLFCQALTAGGLGVSAGVSWYHLLGTARRVDRRRTGSK